MPSGAHLIGMTARLLAVIFSTALLFFLDAGSISAKVVAAAPKKPSLGQISASSGEFACGVTRAGEGLCWGWDGSDPESSTSSDGRVAIPSRSDWSSLSVTQGRGCGVITAGAIVCWGPTSGNGEDIAPAGHTWLSVSTVPGRTCGVDAGHNAYCWGYENSYAPVPAGKKWRSIVAHETGGCGVTQTGEGLCWTQNVFHESEVPTLPAGRTWKSITTDYTTSCGVSSTGAGYCWGQTNDFGQRTVPAGKAWKQIEAGNWNSCGVTTSGEGFCWGKTASINEVPAGKKWYAIVAREYGTACGVTTSGEGLCWGANQHGQNTLPAGKFSALTKPGKPAVKWGADKRKVTVTATITPTGGVTYTLTAKLGRKVKIGKCKAKGKKVVCTLKTGKGKWAFSVTPSNAAGPGTANGKAIKF